MIDGMERPPPRRASLVAALRVSAGDGRAVLQSPRVPSHADPGLCPDRDAGRQGLYC